MVDIYLDQSQIEKLRRTVGRLERGIPRALTPAINRALASGKTAVTREIRKEYFIKQKDIPIRVDRATYGKMQGQIVIQEGMMDLNKFKLSPSRYTGLRVLPGGLGLLAKVKKRGIHLRMRDAFFFPMPRSGYEGPFMRATGAGRLPIHKLITISPAIMATQPEVEKGVNKVIGNTLAKRLDHEIERVMAGIGGKTL